MSQVYRLPPVRAGLVAYWPMQEFVGHNLVTNGGFEDYPVSPGLPAGWLTTSGGGGMATVSEASGRTGKAVRLETTVGGASTFYGLSYTLPSLTAGQAYRVRAWARVEGGVARVFIRNLTDNTTHATLSQISSAGWSETVGEFTPAAGKSYAVWLLTRFQAAAGERVFFDDVRVEQVGPVLDVAGGHHGVNAGSTLQTSGRFGPYRTFDGVDDALRNVALESPSGAFSYFAWVRQGRTNTVERVMYHGPGATAHGFTTNSGVMRFTTRGAGGTFNQISTPSTTRWALYVGVWDGTTMRLYKNMNEVATLVPGDPPGLRTGIHIGSEETGNAPFLGDIGPCGIYNRALSPLEVRRLFESHPLSRLAKVGGSLV